MAANMAGVLLTRVVRHEDLGDRAWARIAREEERGPSRVPKTDFLMTSPTLPRAQGKRRENMLAN